MSSVLEWNDAVAYIKELPKPTVHQLLQAARQRRDMLIQPRCGVGSHEAMRELLIRLERDGQPDILTLTIDSYTRLLQFDIAANLLSTRPQSLNGYPLVSHGWERGRMLNEAVRSPLQIRHGSPNARRLFDTAIMSGITAFEGGGISYNVPYSKDVPLSESLRSWQEIDRACGRLAAEGIHVDREFFGTLTAVLIPPAISLSVTLIEAILAAREGVKCVSIAYPQGGHLVQDVAALRAIERLAAQHLPDDVEVFTVFHQWMGPFPRERNTADALIFYGSTTARIGGASKLVTKTYQEAMGIPSAEANALGMLMARVATSKICDFVTISDVAVEDEMHHIIREVNELIEPVVSSHTPMEVVLEAFARGWLDIPFSPSRHVLSAVLPMRDAEGAIRFFDCGNLMLSETSKTRHRVLLEPFMADKAFNPMQKIQKDIFYFCDIDRPNHVERS